METFMTEPTEQPRLAPVSQKRENRVRSEVGQLTGVMVHRPGRELLHLMPRYLDELLFDEIPWMRRARDEHDGFVELLRSFGVDVLYIERLLVEALALPGARETLVDRQLAFSRLVHPETQAVVRSYLLSLTDSDLIETLIAGLPKSEVQHLKRERTLSDLTAHSYPFFLDPLPSMYFTRDHGVQLGERLLVSAMSNYARRRETLFLRFLAASPLLAGEGVPTWFDAEIPTSIEGGDVLVLSPWAVAVGLSERTSEEAVETVARRLLREDGGFSEVVVLQIPARRAFMHLDTVFTMVDVDKFLIYPGIEGALTVYSMRRGPGGQIDVSSENDLPSTLSRVLGVPAIDLIRSGGSDPIAAAREQWGDSTNTLAVAPGQVVVYNRNEETNRALKDHGIEVLEIEGSELVRGRGGPRCMTMPLLREDPF